MTEKEDLKSFVNEYDPEAAMDIELKKELKTKEEELEKTKKENFDLKDKFLRTLAELENTRRIANDEKEKSIKFAITNFAKDLLGVIDNFYLAFKSVENTEKQNEFKIFFDGIELTFNEFKRVCEKNNLKRIFPINEQFNPDFHNAITQIESNEESGTIVEVMQAGYILNERVIRPALVAVAK